MTRRFACVAAVVGLATLSGCDNLNEVAGLGQLEVAGGGERSIVVGAPPPRRMQALVESRGIRETLSLVSEREGHQIWRASGGDTLTLREGVVVATTALTPDLFSVEATLPSEWRSVSRPATTDRIHRLIDGDEQVVLRGYRCVISATEAETITLNGRSLRTGRTQERCFNATQSFTNIYWLDGSGRMIQSRQWLGPELGYLRLNERLR